MKSEVDVFSIDDLAKVDQEPWDGVRNHAAKNIQKSMRTGDLAFFWGSNTKEPGIMGVVEVVRVAHRARRSDRVVPSPDPPRARLCGGSRRGTRTSTRRHATTTSPVSG